MGGAMNEKERLRREAVEAEARANEEAGNTRMTLGGRIFEAPGARHGAAQHKPHTAKTWARRDVTLPGRSMRAERKEQEQRAAEKHAETPEERMARFKAMATKKQLEARAAGRKRQGLVDANLPSGVWQLGSWMNGDARCPDERVEWENRP
jgi:hypothetical protein